MPLHAPVPAPVDGPTLALWRAAVLAYRQARLAGGGHFYASQQATDAVLALKPSLKKAEAQRIAGQATAWASKVHSAWFWGRASSP